jgi:OOP family OmpA-OmpF porin
MVFLFVKVILIQKRRIVMRGGYRIFVVLLLFFGLLPAASFAETKPSAISFSPFAGGYVFEGNQDLKNAPVYGLGIAYNFSEHWAGEGVFTFIPTETDYSSGGNRDEEVYGLRTDLLYHFRPGKKLVPYLAAGLGVFFLNSHSSNIDNDFLIDYGAGLKYFVTPDIALRADIRQIFDFNSWDVTGTPDIYNNLSYTAGMTFQFGGVEKRPQSEDSDGDGVIDAFDRCPGTPLGVPVDGFGCPADVDKDGVYDYLDKCPGTPAGTAVDRTGCPAAPHDSDGDGVPDNIDKCPGTPSGNAVDSKGCPKVVPNDADGDGVLDEKDKCPDTPASVPVNEYGCPRDTDGDGVFDVDDKCPGTPAGTAVDARGCPIAVPEKFSLPLDVQFASGQAVIRPQYRPAMEKAAQFIQKYPGRKVLVEGHTDSIGSAHYNLRLSQQRAESVRNYLIENFGIDPAKIIARGYGETDPGADNSTQEGRQRNRRVVIVIE